jgi:uncharacterized membrane protein
MPDLLPFVHLLASSIFLGTSVFMALLLPSAATGAADAVSRRSRYVVLLKVYGPLSIGSLGVVLITGAYQVTSYKQNLGSNYFELLGAALAWKLTMAFLVIMLATWVAIGMGLRMVRAEQGGLPVTDPALDKLLMRISVGLWMTIIATAYTLWVALHMTSVPH